MCSPHRVGMAAPVASAAAQACPMVQQGFLGLSSGVARGRPWLAQVARQSRPYTGRGRCGWLGRALADPFVFGEDTLLSAACANSGCFTFVSSSPLPGSRRVGGSVPTADHCLRIWELHASRPAPGSSQLDRWESAAPRAGGSCHPGPGWAERTIRQSPAVNDHAGDAATAAARRCRTKDRVVSRPQTTPSGLASVKRTERMRLEKTSCVDAFSSRTLPEPTVAPRAPSSVVSSPQECAGRPYLCDSLAANQQSDVRQKQ